MKDNQFNYLEIFNETTLLIISALMFGFTDYLPEGNELKSSEDNDMRYNIGWGVIAIVSLYIVVNMFFILQGIFQGIKNILLPKILALFNLGNQKAKIED